MCPVEGREMEGRPALGFSGKTSHRSGRRPVPNTQTVAQTAARHTRLLLNDVGHSPFLFQLFLSPKKVSDFYVFKSGPGYPWPPK